MAAYNHPASDDNIPTLPVCLNNPLPLVISDCKDVLVYSLDDGELTQLPSLYGQDANTVLLNVMDTDIRNATVAEKLNDLLDLIQKNDFINANALLNTLSLELPENHLELVKARMLLRKQEIKHARNN